MVKRKASFKRPDKFTLGTFEWTINYLDVEHDNHGETLKDTRELNIITRSKSEQVLKDTLLHECLHVVLEDIIDTAVQIENKPEIIEEQVVRLLTPRLHELFTNNIDLRDYIFSKVVDKSAKK